MAAALAWCGTTLHAEPSVGSPILQFKYDSGSELVNSGSSGGTAAAVVTPGSSSTNVIGPAYGNSGAWPTSDGNSCGLWIGIPTAASYTLSTWVYLQDDDTATAPNRTYLWVYGPGVHDTLFAAGAEGTLPRPLRLTLVDSSNTNVLEGVTVTTIPYASWTHLVFRVVDNGSGGDVLSFFKNGVATTNITMAAGVDIGLGATDLFLGRAHLGSNQGWQGFMDDTRFYGSALTDAEIKLLAVPEPSPTGDNKKPDAR